MSFVEIALLEWVLRIIFLVMGLAIGIALSRELAQEDEECECLVRSYVSTRDTIVWVFEEDMTLHRGTMTFDDEDRLIGISGTDNVYYSCNIFTEKQLEGITSARRLYAESGVC